MERPASHPRRAVVLALLIATLGSALPAGAWPAKLAELLGRDARRLVPLSLARLLSEREEEILERSQRFSPELLQRLTGDLSQGRLSEATLAALRVETDTVLAMLQGQEVHEGLLRLGALMRVPADLTDPVLAAGPEGYPPGVVAEYYEMLDARLERIPVVLDGKESLELTREDLPRYWQGQLDRSRIHAPVIRIELFRQGKVVDQRTVHERNPVFGVASMAYSRGVTAIAATWLAVWREANGDLTRQPRQEAIRPRSPRRDRDPRRNDSR